MLVVELENHHHGAELLISEDPCKKLIKIALDLEKSNKERQSIEVLLSDKVNKEVKNTIIILY